jgi:polar amino acid transport system substrate-binding protein
MLGMAGWWRRVGAVSVTLLSVALFGGAGARPAAAETPVRLVFAESLTPLSFAEAGETRGILVDIARDIIARDLDRAVEVALYPWERAQQMVRRGEADGFITISTPARREYAQCGTVPVIEASLHPLVRKADPKRAAINAAASLADLRPFSIITYRGNGWARENLEKAGFDVFFAPDYVAHLRGLAQGRGDLALVTGLSGAYYVKSLDLGDQLVMLPPVIDTFRYVLCLGKQSPHVGLMPEFEAALGRKRTDGSYAAVLEAYGFDPTAPY